MLSKILEQFKFLREDFKRWKASSFRDYFYLFFEQGIWAIFYYRLGRALFLIDIPIVKIPLRLISFFLLKFSEVFLGAAIKPAADIGPGLYVGHVGLIRIHPRAVIGKNFSIGPGSIIGQKGFGIEGVPVIGDNVYIGTGAKVIGKVTLGNNVIVGANAVVIKDVPDDTTVGGVPAKVIERKKK